jgi:Arc/MetJ-type ribon-helix-helix transcriptional regulator
MDEDARVAGRLVKLVLPAELVRHMDRAILSAAGAYQDRSEFVAEAIRDRLAEEEALRDPDVPPLSARVGAAGLEQAASHGHPTEESAVAGSLELGRWRRSSPHVLAAVPTHQMNFGLHNRDLPTLWAFDRLALMTADAREPVEWTSYIERIRNEAIYVAEHLRMRDLGHLTALRVGVGFPKPGPKLAASIERFVASSIGSNRRADGPFFVLALAAVADEFPGRLSPTDAGLRVLADMIERGLGISLPQPPAAFECWWDYIRALAPVESAAWLKVLQAVTHEPTRDELTGHFPEWRGHLATTNTVGFISRSREWGLVEPALVEGRYRLSDLGRAVAERG